jgi:predicted extracellular nuclease
MGKIRVATFNVENLLQRFNFYSYGRLTVESALRLRGVESDDPEYFTLRKALHVGLTDDSRQMTAQAIRDLNANVVCLQEVDNKEVLDDFHDRYLEKSAGVHLGWRRVYKGNDLRGIDVGVMADRRIDVISHAEITFDDFDLFNDELRAYGLSEGDRIFRRDCLQVKLKVGEKDLSLFVCHFKSMAGRRDETIPVRTAEASAVRKIIKNTFDDPSAADWLILGDLNDYIADAKGKPLAEHGLKPLFEDGFSKNLIENLPPSQRWTHYYPSEDSKHQLDYVLASPATALKNPKVKPTIIRNGQPYRVPKTDNIKRYPRVGFDRPKASDHCPVAVTLKI